MNTNDPTNHHAAENRVWTGIFLVLSGSFFLAYKMGAPFPNWLLKWPSILIACGIFIGIRNRFNNLSWLVLIVIGGLFLADEILPDIDLHNYLFPIILIAVGFIFIVRPKRLKYKNKRNFETKTYVPLSNTYSDSKYLDDAEYIDDSSFLGSINKVIISKNFKGGEINCVLGGAQIDLSQADIQGQTVLEINQVFGGTKIIVPANWNLKIEIVAVLGGVEDKRSVQATAVDVNKVLVLKGTAVFGGLEIKNY